MVHRALSSLINFQLAILTFVPFLYHSPFSTGQKQHQAARDNYMAARADAKAFGRERRIALKKEAQQMRLERLEKEQKYKNDDATYLG
jgi:hypothetical protein